MARMAEERRDVIAELNQPFSWPLRKKVEKANNDAKKDFLAGEKKLIDLFHVQFRMFAVHTIMAVVALLILAFSL